MDGYPIPRLPVYLAFALVLLALGALSVPPLQLVQRLDRAIYDLWSVATAPPAPENIVLVRLSDPAWQQALLNVSRHYGARLVISTLPQPPAGGNVGETLGPVAIGGGNALVLRETDWPVGGHLWLRDDFDGVIRHDWPFIEAISSIPSLALAGAQTPLGNASGTRPGSSVSAASGEAAAPVDRQGRRWLRFYGGRPFMELTPSQILAAPELLRGKIVVAGRDTAARHETPIGPLTTRELLAHALAGYQQGRAVRADLWSQVPSWAAATALVLVLAVLPLGRLWTLVVTGTGTGGLLSGSALAFAWSGLWLAVAGPVLLVLTGGGYAAWIAGARGGPRAAREHNPGLTEARRMAARGALGQAWRLYREMRLDAGVLGELYQLGCALEQAGDNELAIDVFHRIAQVDPGYREVASHLVKGAEGPRAPQPIAEPRSRPATLGRYQILEVIGHGAMGTVYLGRDPKINRIVAIKAIDLAEEFDPEYIDEARNRFVREAETAGRLNHPDIVTIFDAGEERDLAYIAMEFLKGRHLSAYCEPQSLLPVPQVLELSARTAEALHYAHDYNVVHRDIKPANIMYDSASDTLKITDFGIARLMDVSRTQTGIVLGTPSFMSPEQLEGENVNGHTDLFALGVSLYQLLTGHLPFQGTSMTQLMFVIANEPHPPVTAIRTDLPACLDAVVDQALAKDPTSRFESGARMAHALREIAPRVS